MAFLQIKIKERRKAGNIQEGRKNKAAVRRLEGAHVGSAAPSPPRLATQTVLRVTINFAANEDNKEVSPRGVTRTHAPRGVTGGRIYR
ncbi:hypothetical protein E2C01_004162 [Portunus trituberculatus]|uniref:Uncharacterized protein n=1 Tax=Portunus trituberculatus TaxID=210409 RepID=A0A5B7CQM9_PORTR|nr:hypothetical protein [Portunus trituberculatus]